MVAESMSVFVWATELKKSHLYVRNNEGNYLIVWAGNFLMFKLNILLIRNILR